MKDLKKLAWIDIHNAMIDGLGRCVYSGHKPPKHSDVEYMVDVLQVFLNEKVEIENVQYDRNDDGLCVWVQTENSEIRITFDGLNLDIIFRLEKDKKIFDKVHFETDTNYLYEIHDIIKKYLKDFDK